MACSRIESVALAIAAAWLCGCGGGAADDTGTPSPLTRRDREPAGAHCEHGGTAIQIGLDRDGDAVLDDVEIDRTEYVCDASAAVRVRTDHVTAAPGCPADAIAVRTGIDDDGDGSLDDAEIDHTEYVCAVAHPAVVRKDRQPASPSCPTGAIAVRTGIDDNGNGSLDDAEIDATTVVCDSLELWDGDFTAADWQDPAKVDALHGARVIFGSLTVTGPNVSLPSLEFVVGAMTVTAAAGTAPPSFGALARVGGTLSLTGGGTGAQPMIDAPALSTINGHLIATGPGTLTATALHTLGGSLVVGGSIPELHLDKLATIGGGITISNHVPSLVLPALTTVGQGLSAFFSDLATIDLPRLADMGGSVSLQSLAQLTTISIASLTAPGAPEGSNRIAGSFVLFNLSALRTVDLGRLETISSELVVVHAPALSTFTAGSLVSVGGFLDSLRIEDTGLELLDLPKLDQVIDLTILRDPALREVRMPRLFLIDQLTLAQCSALDTVTAPKILNLMWLLISDTALRTLDVSQLTAVEGMVIARSPLAGLSAFSHVNNIVALAVTEMPELHDLSGLSSLRALGGLEITSNPALVSLDGLDPITSVSTSVKIAGNPALTSLAGLHNVTGVGALDLQANAALSDAALPGLRSILGSLRIADMPALSSLSGLGALVAVGGAVTLNNNPGLSDDEIAAFMQQLGR